METGLTSDAVGVVPKRGALGGESCVEIGEVF
jgi:hypothetical protein